MGDGKQAGHGPHHAMKRGRHPAGVLPGLGQAWERVVAGEEFIAAVAAEGDRDVAAGEAAEEPGG